MQNLRVLDFTGVIDHVFRLVGKLSRYTFQRQGRKVRGLFVAKRAAGVHLRSRNGERRQEESGAEKQAGDDSHE